MIQKIAVAAIAAADKNVGAAVIAGVDAPPVLEFAEHILDFVASFIERPVEGDFGLAIVFRRDAGVDASPSQCLAKPVRIIALVAKKGFGFRNNLKYYATSSSLNCH